MSTVADPRYERSDADLPADSPAPALVYLVVGFGLAVNLIALLFARGTVDFVAIVLALLVALPFLLYARLAMARPGVEAVVAGVLLLAVGTWGSVVGIDDGSVGDFVWLPLSLIAVQLIVFGIGRLLRIADPNHVARKPLTDGMLAFPFFTIENVDVVDATHIVVGNDNNLPFSSSREPNRADDNELVLLEVGEFLRAR